MTKSLGILCTIVALSLCSCDTSSPTVTVTGTALNAKAGAVVETDNGVYYIQGLDEWPDAYHGKKVEVTGIPSSVYHKKKSTKDRQVTEMTGTQDFLSHAKYRLVKE